MNRRLMLKTLLGFGAAGLVAGCNNGPASATVTGEVKINGTILKKGSISYAPADTTGGTPVTVNVVDGKYEIRTTAGKKFVQISAPVVTDRRKESSAPDAPMIEFTSESLPPKYNSATELTFDVKPGSNTKDWDLEVKKK